MQFDQRTLIRIGLAVIVVIVGLVAQLLSGATDKPAPPARETADQQSPPASERSGVPRETTRGDLPLAPGTFDYYVLVLSWSPTHCSSPAGRGADDDMQCRSGRPY